MLKALVCVGISMSTPMLLKVNAQSVSYYTESHLTASGERLDRKKLTGAHKKLPFNTVVKLTIISGHRGCIEGKTTTIRINDRGPYIKGREFDVSLAAAKELGLIGPGYCKIKYEILK